MQTFLPYEDFAASAAVLDRLRLGKQRVECLQLLNTFVKKRNGAGGGWMNHPALLMWEGHEIWLINYGVAVCDEWIARGYNDTTKSKIVQFKHEFDNNVVAPAWLGDTRVHQSHKAALLYKDVNYYSQFNWGVNPELNYFWPVTKNTKYETHNNRTETSRK